MKRWRGRGDGTVRPWLWPVDHTEVNGREFPGLDGYVFTKVQQIPVRVEPKEQDREDLVFFALNIDEDTSAVKPFLAQFQFKFESELANAYAHEFLPVSGVPANYIIDSRKTAYFTTPKRGDAWIEAAAAALSERIYAGRSQ